MKAINPIFNSNLKKSVTNGTPDIKKRAKTKEEGRKERCDRKKDVKIPFTEEERILVKKLARKRNLEPTPYCSFLVKQALTKKYVFPICEYNPKGKPYPAKLESYYHDLLFDYTLQWDCSFKEAAYRIIRFMLDLESRQYYGQ